MHARAYVLVARYEWDPAKAESNRGPWRGPDTVRLISARKATRTERTQYGRGEP
ncbi:hypothetical protein BH20GEM2_BH20GEM2_10280 [soil metagenome]